MLKLMLIDGEEFENKAIVKVLDEMFKGRLAINTSRGVKQTIKGLKSDNPHIVILEYRDKLQGRIIMKINKYLKQCYCIAIVNDLLMEQHAIEVGLAVKEFIIKPIRRCKLVEVMDRAIISVMEKESRKVSYKTAEFKNNMVRSLEEELFEGIIKNDLSNIDYNLYMEYLNFHFSNAFAVIIIGDDILFCYKEIKKLVYQYSKLDLKILGPYMDDGEIICFIEIQENSSSKLRHMDIIKEIAARSSKAVGIKIKVGIGTCYSGITNIYNSYKEAKNNIIILN